VAFYVSKQRAFADTAFPDELAVLPVLNVVAQHPALSITIVKESIVGDPRSNTERIHLNRHDDAGSLINQSDEFFEVAIPLNVRHHMRGDVD
jgi:hypothetical protein